MRRLPALIPAILVASCGETGQDQASGEVAVAQQALTAGQERVLGFESPTSDWTSRVALAASATVTAGTQALSVTPAGYTEIISQPLSSLGTVDSTFTLDVRLPGTASWGEIRLVLAAPSIGMYWQDLGSVSLPGLPAGAYREVSFAVPASVRTALAGDYSDLTFRLIVNGPDLGGAWLFDDLRVTSGQGGDPGDEPGAGTVFTLSVPRGVAVRDAFMSATHRLWIEDRVTLSALGEADHLASLGAAGAQIGAGTMAYGSLTSEGSVFLGSRAHFTGTVTTEQTITRQDGVQIDEGSFEHAPVEAASTSWSVTWPGTNGGEVYLPPDTERQLAPGAWGTLNVQSGSEVYLRPGTYFFESFNTEPGSSVIVDAAAGQAIIYVRNSFVHKGPIVQSGGDPGKVFVGYLGTSAAFLQAPYVGAMVAPNGAIELHRPTSEQHKGSFFAREIHAFSDSTILHLPFDGGFLCPAGDFDKDGVFDCTDLCPRDPAKVAPGFCGCNIAEIDADGDGIPSCLETCDGDASKTNAGTCGCSPNYAPAGTPCADGVCAGKGQCDGKGQCGEPESCSPEPGKCRYRVFNHRVYWVCDGGSTTRDDARQKCESQPNRTLVHIDDAKENQLIADLLGDRTAWIGANDGVTEGSWYWSLYQNPSYRLFWKDGARQNRSFLAWASGQPSAGAGENCGAINGATGTWSDETCDRALPYVCENLKLDDGTERPPPSCHDFASSEDCTEYQPDPECVPSTSGFLDGDGDPLDEDDQAVFEAMVEACRTQCPTGSEAACSEVCVGAASIPPPNSTCSFSEEEQGKCGLVDPDLSFECASSDDCQVAGQVCARYYDCSACDTRDAETKCTGHCVATMRCGTPDPLCATLDDQPCGEVSICVDDADIVDGDPFNDPETNLEPTTLLPEDVFTPPEDEVTGAYPIDPYLDGSACGSQQNADHPWCHFGLNAGLQSQGAGDEGTADDKKARAGAGSALEFSFDPNLDLQFEMTPKAFGELDMFIRGEASFLAQATVQILGGGATIDIVDALAGIEATRCGAASELRLEVFGIDMLPVLIEDENLRNSLNTSVPSEAAQAACNTAITDFENALDRAKKALRDAQDLLRQYRAINEAGNHLDPVAFCEAVTAQAPGDFYGGDCATELPEQTINRFIAYYEQQVFGVYSGDFGRLGGLQNALSQLQYHQLRHTVELPPVGRSENWKIASAQFFLGPVPLTMSLEAFIGYGIRGLFEASVTPTLPTDGNPVTLANVRAQATPYADAGVSLFVGVGFSAGPFEASAGVDGRVTLGVVELPAHAGAGIVASTEPDERDITVQEPNADGILFPVGGAHRYNFALAYDFSGRIQVRNVLSGSLGASVRVRFAFFSKRWRKELIRFKGLPTDPNQPYFYDEELFKVEGQPYAIGGFDWGVVEMPMPFIRLKALEVPATPNLQGTAVSHDPTCAEELFYENQCTCLGYWDYCNPWGEGKPCCDGLQCLLEISAEGYVCKQPDPIP